MKKRLTLLSDNGILYQREDTNSFELDLPAIKKLNPTATMLTLDCQPIGETGWYEIGTIYTF